MAEGADEAPFASGQNNVVLCWRQAEAIQVTQCDDPTMSMNDALGFPGSAGGINDKSRFVGERGGWGHWRRDNFGERVERNLVCSRGADKHHLAFQSPCA